jgi:ribosomal protein S2
MNRRPDAVFILDTKKEQIAVTEANFAKFDGLRLLLSDASTSTRLSLKHWVGLC